MTVEFHFLGCGDAFAGGGRLQTTLLLDAGGERWLIDCGATALVAMKRAQVSTASIEGVLVSHLHGDHFGGLPFVVLDAGHLAGRERPLVLAGPPGLDRRLEVVTEAFYPGLGEPGFAVETVALAEEAPARLGGLTVTPFAAVHPSGAPAFMLRIEVAGRTIAFTGDTGWTETLFRLADGADLLIAECSSHDRRFANHLDYTTLLARRAGLRCRRLILTHLGADVVARAEAGELEIETAHDGMVVEV